MHKKKRKYQKFNPLLLILYIQIVGDYDGLVTHVNAANPGTCNDIYVMNGSQIKHLGDRGDFKGFYLLGDSGYV